MTMTSLLVLEYMTALGMTMVLLFLDSRYSRRTTVLAVYGVTALAMAAVAVLYRTAGVDAAVRGYSLVVHVPALLLFMFLSRYRGWRLVFQFMSAILFCMLIQHIGGVACYLWGDGPAVILLAYAIPTAGAIWFLIRFLRPLLFRVLLELKQGWWLMCLVLAAYYAIVIYLIPGYVGVERSSTVLKPVISLLVVGFYSVLMVLFSDTWRAAETRHSAQLSAMQVSALRGRVEATRATEEAIHIERHDMRHQLQAVAGMVEKGERAQALAFIGASQERLDALKPVRWCQNPVLDAIFSSYLEQAKRQGIQVEASLAVPESLPVDAMELSTVFANALENAIHACADVPEGERKLVCRCLNHPQLMFEVANTYAGQVRFDADGLPVADQPGHGVGTRSIAAFCEKHDASCAYEAKDGWFRIRVVL